jgi:hypothetical protein
MRVYGESKHWGVCWDRQKNRWRAQVRHEGRQRYIGLFEAEDDAAGAAERFAKDHGIPIPRR